MFGYHPAITETNKLNQNDKIFHEFLRAADNINTKRGEKDYFAICINTSGSAALCCDCWDSMLASHWPRPSHWLIRLNSSQNSLEIICENPPLTNKSSDQDITAPLSSHRSITLTDQSEPGPHSQHSSPSLVH